MANIIVENIIDDEEFSFTEFVSCNVPSENSDAAEFEVQFEGCDCKGYCEEQDCSCISRYGCNYDNSGKLLAFDLDKKFAKPILECNRQCLCSPDCTNRQVQRGIQYCLCIFKTPNKGWGLKTKQHIPSNHFVCEYAGEILNKAEAKKRLKNLHPFESNYLLIVREHVAGNKVIETFIDPKYKGSIGRFINHSCEPNLIMIPVRIDNLIPKLCLFSLKNIDPEEELTYHYSGLHGNNSSDACNEATEILKPCACASKNCTGYLPYCAGVLL